MMHSVFDLVRTVRLPLSLSDVDTLDNLHSAAVAVALDQQDRTGSCPHLWIAGFDNLPPQAVETRWGGNEEKQAVLRSLWMTFSGTPEIMRYAYMGEAYALRTGAGTNRANLPRDLRNHPEHYETLMIFAFERSGGTRQTVYWYPPGHPEQRALDPLTNSANANFAGDMWNLFK